MKVLGKVFQATAVSYLASLIVRLDLEVIHAHFYGLASAVAAMVSGKTGIPCTFTCHTMDIFTSIHKYGDAQSHESIRDGDYHFTV